MTTSDPFAYIQDEVVNKKRTLLVSGLVRLFDLQSVVEGIEKLRKDYGGEISFFAKQTVWLDEGMTQQKVSVVEVGVGEGPAGMFAIKPKESLETWGSVFRKISLDAKAEILKAKPSLFVPPEATVATAECPQREIREVAGVGSATVGSVGGLKKVEKKEEQKTSFFGSNSAKTQPKQSPPVITKQAPVSAPISSPSAPASPNAPRVNKAKFQVPLDSLDDAETSAFPTDKVSQAEPEVKRQKTQVDVQSVSSSSVPDAMEEGASVVSLGSADAASSAPVSEMREVIIKKKVIVTEYESGPNGEMIVRDVEKMVEERRMESVRTAPAVKSGAAKLGAQKTNAKKPAPAGQATLSGFFKSSAKRGAMVTELKGEEYFLRREMELMKLNEQIDRENGLMFRGGVTPSPNVEVFGRSGGWVNEKRMVDLEEEVGSLRPLVEENKRLQKKLGLAETQVGELTRRLQDIGTELKGSKEATVVREAEMSRLERLVKKAEADVKVKEYRLTKAGEEIAMLKERIRDSGSRTGEGEWKLERSELQEELRMEKKKNREILLLVKKMIHLVNRMEHHCLLTAKVKELDAMESTFETRVLGKLAKSG